MTTETRFINIFCPTCERLTRHTPSVFGFYVCWDCLNSDIRQSILAECRRLGRFAALSYVLSSEEHHP